MMTVYEYASDMNKTVGEILDLCKKLEIKANDKDDELSDDTLGVLDVVVGILGQIIAAIGFGDKHAEFRICG